MVVSDSVFSMDGDVAPVRSLSELCGSYGALLVLDDAHLVFDIEAPDPGVACLRVGTLSKALGSQGGYLAGPRSWMDLLVNRARSFIFTTALAPASAAAALAAVGVYRSREGDGLRARLRQNICAIRPGHPRRSSRRPGGRGECDPGGRVSPGIRTARPRHTTADRSTWYFTITGHTLGRAHGCRHSPTGKRAGPPRRVSRRQAPATGVTADPDRLPSGCGSRNPGRLDYLVLGGVYHGVTIGFGSDCQQGANAHAVT